MGTAPVKKDARKEAARALLDYRLNRFLLIAECNSIYISSGWKQHETMQPLLGGQGLAFLGRVPSLVARFFFKRRMGKLSAR